MKKGKNCSHCTFALWTSTGVKCSFDREPIDQSGNSTMYQRRELKE